MTKMGSDDFGEAHFVRRRSDPDDGWLSDFPRGVRCVSFQPECRRAQWSVIHTHDTQHYLWASRADPSGFPSAFFGLDHYPSPNNRFTARQFGPAKEHAKEARKEADRLACGAWNKRMLGFRVPAQPIAPIRRH
jgi:hypothetical protein